jgi:molybdopterin converting factor small subunit
MVGAEDGGEQEMITVRLYPGSVLGPARGEKVFSVEARPGLTVEGLLREAGVPRPDYFVVMINGYGAGIDSVLSDGDSLVLFPAISGG